MSISRSTVKRTIATTQLLLIVPAALFMTAVVVRTNTTQQIVMWYAGRGWTLWVLLIGLPLSVLVIGCTTLLESWNDDGALRQAAWQTPGAVRAHLATVLIAAATVAAGGVLAVVGLHMLAN